MRTFDLEEQERGPVTVIAVEGSVDAVTAPRLSEALAATVAAGRVRLVVDLGGVDYVSSSALRALLAGVKGSRAAAGDLRLAAVPPPVARVFELAGFDGIVQRFDDADAAALSFA